MILGLFCPLRRWRGRGPRQQRRKIAILGGGMAGLSAAYQLTRTPELRKANHVTVYQLGWRLGGKAASGRDAQGRNVEHGLHVWFGCYENTFRLLQELYEARRPAPDARLRSWRDAVKPQTYTPIGALKDDGTWSYWPLSWPTNDGTPGEGGLLPTLGEVLETVLGGLAEFLSHRGQAPAAETLAAAGPPPPGVAVPQAAPALVAARAHIRQHGSRLHHQTEHELNHLLDLVGWARDAHARTRGAAAAKGSEDRLVHDVLVILRAAMQGIAFDLILKNRPFEDLDDEDFRAWLIRHGADSGLVTTSSVVRVVYDTLFQYIDGDVTRPSYAAGTALGVIARLIGTYKGSMMWDIQAGMGEVLIAPLYEHLLEAGVRFKFFRKVTSVEPAPDAPLVKTIRLDRQADMRDGAYSPTIAVDGLTCWPAEPLWDQLKDGAAMAQAGVDFESYWCTQPPAGQEVLRQGVDFDVAILAISLGAYKTLNDADASFCAGLMRRS
ncbi:MAG: NAD(P)-binding protein, partial [Alphaproteobacteria bacterium]|nr:NAD(P)-binding protein [Alphaproteobacteria bacterium]